jgi:hypothetical protein
VRLHAAYSEHTLKNEGVYENPGRGPRQRLGSPSRLVEASQEWMTDEPTAFPFGGHDDLAEAAAKDTAHLMDRPEPRAG